MAAPPGFYADPAGAPGRRWWDGTQWTGYYEAPQVQRRWRAVRPWVPFVVAGLLLAAAAQAAAIAAYVRRLDVIGKIGPAGLGTQRVLGTQRLVDAAKASDTAVTVASVVAYSLVGVAGVCWLLWFARLYDDAALLGPVRHSRWKVWGWVVPVVSLFRPKQLVNDVWTATSPDPAAVPAEPVGWVVQVWWPLWLGAQLVGRAAQWFAPPPGTSSTRGQLTALRGAAVTNIVAHTLLALAAVAAVLVVLRLTARVEERGRARGLTEPWGATTAPDSPPGGAGAVGVSAARGP
jgi:hypothetical protein